MIDLSARVLWFLAHLDSDTPTRMHRSGVWVDSRGMGSRLGSPALDASFECWLYAAEARMTEVLEVTCYHVGVEQGVPCSTCSALVEGELYETGVRRTERDRYCWPMRATIARLHSWTVPRGRPRLSETLFTIERTEGDLSAAARTLACRYPAMSDPATALAHFEVALRQAEAQWREDAPPRLLPRTEVLPPDPDEKMERPLAR